MTVRAHLDNFSTTLAEDITTVETDIDVDDASGVSALFTDGVDIVPMTITDGTSIEIVHVTSVASNTLTTIRGREGTSGTAFSTGDSIECRATSESLNQNKPHFLASAPSDVFTNSYTTSNKVDFATADIDPFGWFNTSSNRWQPTEPGLYYLDATIHVEDPPPNATATIEIWNRTTPNYTYEVYIPDDYSTPATWQATTAYSTGDIVRPTTPDGFRYMCTTAGTSDGTEPTWDTTIGNTTNDNTVVWTNMGEDKYDWVVHVSHIMQLDGGSDYATVRVRHNDSVFGNATYGAGCRFRGWKIN